MSEQTAGAYPEWTLGERIRKARDFAGLDQAELAALVDATRTTVSNWETGATSPNQRKVRRVAMVTGVAVDWLRDGHGPFWGGDGNSVTSGSSTDQYPESYRHPQRSLAAA